LNRNTVLFLALALLLAHMLTVWQDLDGRLAPPCDQAHVAYRMGRAWVHEGRAAFDPLGPVLQGHPSPLWVGVSAACERLMLTVTRCAQGLGMACAMLACIVLSRFSPDRLGGVVAPMLMVVSGSVAAASADGSETAAFMLFVVLAFLGLERERAVLLGAALLGLALVRPEGQVLVLAFGALAVLRGGPRRGWLACFVPAAAAIAGLAFLRASSGGSWIAPELAGFAAPGGVARAQLGLAAWGDFAAASVWPLLTALPLALACLGRLPARAGRALLLGLVGTLLVVLQGGDAEPHGRAFVPVVPLFLIAIQDAVVRALDSRRRFVEGGVWALLLAVAGLSALASKLPGNLGPLPTEALYQRWMAPSAPMAEAYGHLRGRAGALEEIRTIGEQRALGLYLRNRVAAGSTIMTPYPGAVAYLSRKRVFDLLGRATHPPDQPPRAWSGPRRADLVAALELEPDYVVPCAGAPQQVPDMGALVDLWLETYDDAPRAPARRALLLERLAAYELITVPVPIGETLESFGGRSVLLLRARRLELGPELELAIDGTDVVVRMQHRGQPQLGDLELWAMDAGGVQRWLSPLGALQSSRRCFARTGVLLMPTGERQVELFRFALADAASARSVTAVLGNPRADASDRGIALGGPATLDLAR
jgi:hypothetical protein